MHAVQLIYIFCRLNMPSVTIDLLFGLPHFEVAKKIRL